MISHPSSFEPLPAFNFTIAGVPGPKSRQPASETGIYLTKHKHRWLEVGSYKWPSGDVVPVFKCQRCGDVICTEARGGVE